jgi:hypothetical protein
MEVVWVVRLDYLTFVSCKTPKFMSCATSKHNNPATQNIPSNDTQASISHTTSSPKIQNMENVNNATYTFRLLVFINNSIINS